MNKPYYEKPHGDIFVGDICKGYFPLHIHEVVEIVVILEGNLVLNLNGEERMLLPSLNVKAMPLFDLGSSGGLFVKRKSAAETSG